MFADEIIRAREIAEARSLKHQRGEVIVKFFWWPLIISIGLSILLTILLNTVF